MDPLGDSCYSLNNEALFKRQQKRSQNHYCQILGSNKSLSDYEGRSLKTLLPQIFAAVVVSSLRISVGISLAFSAILIPQLKKNPEFEMTSNQASWATSVIALSTPVGTLAAGFLMDRCGRLRTLAMAALPGILGCVTMALSQDAATLIIGRALVGLANGIGSSCSIVYLTEIARKDMRGSLISFIPSLTSFGMSVTFILGSVMSWRQLSWWTNLFILVPCILVLFLSESPAWLVSRDRIAEAKKSLEWIHKYQPKKEGTKSLAELQLAVLQKEHELKMIENAKKDRNEAMSMLRAFFKPTGYKPMLILVGVFFFQQFSGIFIFFFHSISFFQEVGATMDPYVASTFIGVVRFVMSMMNTFVLKTFRRRPLVMISSVGMSASVFLSGLFTYWIRTGATQATWIPVVFLLLFVLTSMIGLVPIPYSMSAELFPLEIRGVSQSVSNCAASILMFLSLQWYPWMCDFFGGIVGIQFFFAAVTLSGIVFVYIFLPETHEKKLSEIEEYFWKNVVFIGQKKSEGKKESAVVSRPSIIVKGQQEQKQSLLEDV